ncbi:hypothetical protein [Occallatibacter riparius]|uniref:Uncharacterized protein n=1 Tax=Occallatibacter riparius TaxID=1002689 RepID=A0A9J7BTK7_9BACT|nr:hypothetical protein [Occallatibacter riparius]UWZ85967.1 hypothetical protein MOP44_08475 [Occallatibacter riparius]
MKLGSAISCSLLLCALTSAGAQNTPTTSTNAKTAETTISVPGGAGATVTSSGTAGAGPIIGFQVSQLDNYFISSFFTISPPQSVSGQLPTGTQTVSADQGNFGAFLLTPPGQGTSYSFAGNRMFGFQSMKAKGCISAQTKSTTAKAAAVAAGNTTGDLVESGCAIYVGFGGRGGVTNTTWVGQVTGGNNQSKSGTVAFITFPELVVTSKTYVSPISSSAAGAANQNNQYQFGVSFGPSWRFIGGDLAQGQSTSTTPTFRSQMLGTDKTSFFSPEVTFFVKMNEFKPYFRFSHFSQPKADQPIPGFTGSQFVFGVDVTSAIFQTKPGS